MQFYARHELLRCRRTYHEPGDTGPRKISQDDLERDVQDPQPPLWLGLLADAFGFESLFMQSWRMREKILDMFEMSTGGRVIFSVNQVGGVLRDMDSDMLNHFLDELAEIEKELKVLSKTFLDDAAVNNRLRGVGYLSKQQAMDLSIVGPFMRASGIKRDMRTLGYNAYKDLDFEPVTSDIGDSYARCEVRIGEIFQSIDLIRQCVAKIRQVILRYL
jgi:ech hydrogenase subunit E